MEKIINCIAEVYDVPQKYVQGLFEQTGSYDRTIAVLEMRYNSFKTRTLL